MNWRKLIGRLRASPFDLVMCLLAGWAVARLVRDTTPMDDLFLLALLLAPMWIIVGTGRGPLSRRLTAPFRGLFGQRR